MRATEEKFDVYQDFSGGGAEQVREQVGMEEAVEAAKHYCSSVGAQVGTTTRVTIIDADDYCVFEWLFGKGVVFPKV